MSDNPLRRDRRFKMNKKFVSDRPESSSPFESSSRNTSTKARRTLKKKQFNKSKRDDAAREGMQAMEPVRVDLSILEAHVQGQLPKRRAVVSEETSKLRDVYSKRTMMLKKDLRRRDKILKDDTQSQITRKKIQDVRIFANACKRAGKDQKEAVAHFRLGVLYDNMEHYKTALKSYEEYREICLKHEDLAGAGLACNCMGVDHHLLARRAATYDENVEKRDFHLNASMASHMEHLSLLDASKEDRPELRFVVYTNLGLVASELEQHDKSVEYHQNALKIAMINRDAPMQSIALENLGEEAHELGDERLFSKCMEQRLEILNEASDLRGVAQTLEKIGTQYLIDGKLRDAMDILERAQDIAMSAGATALYNRAKCQYGIARGESRRQERLRELSSSLMRAS